MPIDNELHQFTTMLTTLTEMVIIKLHQLNKKTSKFSLF